jgi:hypothetical protein
LLADRAFHLSPPSSSLTLNNMRLGGQDCYGIKPDQSICMHCP